MELGSVNNESVGGSLIWLYFGREEGIFLFVNLMVRFHTTFTIL